MVTCDLAIENEYRGHCSFGVRDGGSLGYGGGSGHRGKIGRPERYSEAKTGTT